MSKVSQKAIENLSNILEETEKILDRMALDHAEQDLYRTSHPEEWSARDVLAHLRACADVFSWHIYVMLAVDNPTLPYVHPNNWMSIQGYTLLSFADNLASFKLNRQHLLRKLSSLTLQEWQRTGIIKERNHTVFGEARRMALHEEGHFKQLASLP